MHAGGLDRRNGLNRLLQFAFEGALVVDLFGELADAEFLVVHQFEADRTAFGQALRREPQAHFVDLFGRHEDRAARVGELVRDVGGLQRGDDRAAVAVRQVAVEHLVVGGV